MVPVIGLPAGAPGELEEKDPFRNYFVFVGDPEQPFFITYNGNGNGWMVYADDDCRTVKPTWGA